MKKIKYIILALVGGIFASCMGSDYADPYDTDGDNTANIETINLKTIQEVKDSFKTVINNSSFKEIDKDWQIKGIVTGNDIEGNIYNEVSVQDKSGAIIVAISASGLYGDLPVGQEVLINLKGLYIGGYGQQAEIGGVYSNAKTGATGIGAADRYLWNSHYMKIGAANPAKAEALIEDFDMSKVTDANYRWLNQGKIMRLKNVTIADANNTTAVYAPGDGSVAASGNAINRSLKGINRNNLVLRTSTYADFANAIMPTGLQNITGIFTVFRSTWQVLLRSSSDVETAASPYASLPGTGEGTEASPFDVTRARAVVNAGLNSGEFYVTGIISDPGTFNSKYTDLNYYISEDGTQNDEIEAYRGTYLNGADFTEEIMKNFSAGKTVTIVGTLTTYNTTIEFQAGSKIVSIK